MHSPVRLSKLLLVSGDLLCFVAALWISLFARVLTPPTPNLFLAHFVAFIPLFVVWIGVFFIAGLYEERRILFGRRALSAAILYAQLANVIIAALFFFVIPAFGIAPKTVLAIYLAISFSLVFFWRSRVFFWFGLERPARALVIAAGGEIEELVAALNTSPYSPVCAAEVLQPDAPELGRAVVAALGKHEPDFIIADLSGSGLEGVFPDLYNLLMRGVRFVDAGELYEDVFGRVPLSRVSTAWIARHISIFSHFLYDPLKRAMDIILALLAGVASLIFYPFIVATIAIEGGGGIFIAQERVGQAGRTIRLYKFRTMTGNDFGNYDTSGTSALSVTRAGRFLRQTRLDELPQLWNVLTGDLSLIGPRPELPALVARYEEAIPFYGIRHLVRPGLSGWAQIYHDNHPHHGEAIEATREKLSYDLYYLTRRSFMLDIVIALKTFAKLLTRSGI
ncbi:MAG: sugar transferase [Minisyncoccia bacterium]